MALSRGPKIVTSGLVLALDAADKNSYLGSGTTWTDLSGNGNNATLINTPTYSNNKFYMNGTTQYAEVTSNISTTRTVDIVYKLYNPGTGWGPLWRVEDWRERIFPGTINFIASSVTYYYIDGPDNGTSIINIVYSYNGTSLKSYKNGVIQSTATMDSNMDTGLYTYRFGNQSGGSTNAYVEMDLYSVKFYNRQLTDTEVLQNYNATKTRFGLI
jgi:hypothetical protein